ncbi:hypothetical protein GALMADRAFT_887000 [Galerina marginata CBS 339.88]|uniref:Uncharacterized protein n=1 Tax=Galerina marginata (strain CBS 339.88) TaxID=685588 RepID=A0A067SQZ7_GALM3|nr:hypothetical protein GALMADRAFT_887000 [Galerina marginata CBS 339.88]
MPPKPASTSNRPTISSSVGVSRAGASRPVADVRTSTSTSAVMSSSVSSTGAVSSLSSVLAAGAARSTQIAAAAGPAFPLTPFNLTATYHGSPARRGTIFELEFASAMPDPPFSNTCLYESWPRLKSSNPLYRTRSRSTALVFQPVSNTVLSLITTSTRSCCAKAVSHTCQVSINSKNCTRVQAVQLIYAHTTRHSKGTTC